MPQLNSDEAANDEPKTYHDEAIDGGDGWQDSKDLNDIKGDLVSENDSDRLYDNQANSHRSEDESHRTKHNINRDHWKDTRGGIPNNLYPQQDVDSMVPALGHSLFPNSFLSPSSQLPYSSYINSLLYGGAPPVDVNGKQGSHRDIPSMCALPGHLSQMPPNPLASWPSGPLHSLCTASAMAGMLRYPYPLHNCSSAPGAIRSMPFVPPHSNEIYKNLFRPESHVPGHMTTKPGFGEKPLANKKTTNPKTVSTKPQKSKHPYVKKPLNAFMIFMKEQRAQVISECTLKESAAINQILGRKWHNLEQAEQQKYYEMAQKERQVHMQLFPGWSARENYGKRKRRKKDKTHECSAQNVKKCRAVFGLEEQQSWCAPCRRKKRCVRYQHDGEDSDFSEDGHGPCQYSTTVSRMPAVANDKVYLSVSDHPPPHQAPNTEPIKEEKSLPNEDNALIVRGAGNVPVSNDSSSSNHFDPTGTRFSKDFHTVPGKESHLRTNHN